MAKTESTAVNQLISLVQTATPLKPDPSEDLMFKAPDKAVRKAASRMTATIPPIRAEVPALPRQRAPQGTQRGMPVISEKVRMSTAAQPVTMPEVQPWAAAEGTGEGDVITDVRNEALVKTNPVLDPRATRPSLPPPLRTGSGSLGSRSPLPAATQPAHGDSPRLAPPPIPRASAVMPVEPPKPAPLPPPTPEMIAYPSAAPYMQHVAADMTSHQPWFDEQPPAAPVEEIDVDFGTDRVRAKATDWKALIPKLIAPTLGLIIVGMFVGGYLAFDGQGGKKRGAAVTETKAAAPVAEAPKAAPAPKLEAKAAEPTTPPNLAPHATPAHEAPVASQPVAAIAKDIKTPVVAATAARPAFVDIRLDSTPPGATVTLIDRGKSTFLGTTPISTAVDPSRKYDIVFSHASKPTHIEHLDPTTTKRLAVVLGKTSRKDAPKLEVKKAETPAPAREAKKPAVKAEAPTAKETEPKKTEAPKTETKDAKKAVVDPFDAPKAEPPAPKETPKGDGVLMVSSKPPCEILIDGVATGLTTPQRAIKLTAGTHKVTLVNTAEKIKKTVTITVSADQPTKVIENFMK